MPPHSPSLLALVALRVNQLGFHPAGVAFHRAHKAAGKSRGGRAKGALGSLCGWFLVVGHLSGTAAEAAELDEVVTRKGHTGSRMSP